LFSFWGTPYFVEKRTTLNQLKMKILVNNIIVHDGVE
jgi:hypothetical protein